MGRDRFNYQDAGLVNFDRDSFPHNIGSVGIFEGQIPFDRYLAHVDERLDLVPRYRQRMVRAPFDLAAPAWHDDPNFDIRQHVRSVTLSASEDTSQLLHLAGEFFAEPLDRQRPLWQILHVAGLPDGRTAQLVKAHHCLVDGVGGVQLLIALLDTTREPEAPRRGRRREPQPLPGPLVRFVNGVCDQMLEQLDIAESVALTAVDPASALRWTSSVGKALWAARPYLLQRPPDTPWNTKLSSPRRLAWQDLPLAEARAICSALGGKVNDVVLAVLAGALRRYFLLHGWDTKGVVLRVAVPMNVRSDSEARALGNHVSIMLAGLPLEIEDPRARFQAIRREMKALKDVDQARGINDLLRLLGRLPAPVQGSLGRRLSAPNVVTNLLCTNVRGPETPLYCLGHEMVAHYPWVLVTWRMGLGVAVMSYMQNLWFSFTGDAGVLSDIDRIADFLADEFRELHAAVVAKPPPPVESATGSEAVQAAASRKQTALTVVARDGEDSSPAATASLSPTAMNGGAPKPAAGSSPQGVGEDHG